MPGIDTIARNYYAAAADDDAPETFTREGTAGTDVCAHDIPLTEDGALDKVIYHLQTTAAVIGEDPTSLAIINAAITIDLGRPVFTIEELGPLVDYWAGGREFEHESDLEASVDEVAAYLSR